MRSHYNKLKNVQCVVDCSPPKTLSRFSHSDPSFDHVEMAHLPLHSFGIKKHSCGYRHPPKIDAKPSHPRPKTRRHPDDSPRPRLSERNHTCRKKEILFCTGCSDGAKKSKNSELFHSTLSLTESTSDGNSSRVRNELSQKRTVKPKTGASQVAQEKKQQVSPAKLKTDEKEKQCSPCIKKNPSFHSSVTDQEYLQFLLRITEDIIRYDLYSNEEMKRVFTNHVKANSNRLEMDRMLLKIYELMKELNIPLCCEKGENSNSSWTDITLILRGLLRSENWESDPSHTENAMNSNKESKKNCICFDIRRKCPVSDAPSKKTESEEVNNESFSPSKFEASLDRLTEYTEPFSSRATFKVSTTFSNFEDVHVLPGFESLETPKVSKAVLCEIHCCSKVPRSIQTLSHKSLDKNKLKRRIQIFKRRKKKKKKYRRNPIRGIQDGTIKENPEMNKTETNQCDVCLSKHSQDPVVITLRESKENESTLNAKFNELCSTEMINDYILIEGPVYLSKRFLEEKSIALMQNQICLNMQFLNSNDVIKKPQINGNSEKSQDAKDEHKIPNCKCRRERDKQTHSQNFHNLPVQSNNLPSFPNSSGNREFLYYDKRDGCGHFEDPESGLLCGMKCPHKSKCSRLRSAHENHVPSETPANPLEEYDLTPQRDVQQDNSINENRKLVLSQAVAINIMKTTEIQTEDLPNGSVLQSFNDFLEKDIPEEQTVDFGQSTNLENNVKEKEEQKNYQEKNVFAFEEKEIKPENLNEEYGKIKEEHENNDEKNDLELEEVVNQTENLNEGSEKGREGKQEGELEEEEEEEQRNIALEEEIDQSNDSSEDMKEVLENNNENEKLEKENNQPMNLNYLPIEKSNVRSEDTEQERNAVGTPPIRRSADIPFREKNTTGDSFETSSTVPTLISTATIERTKNYLGDENDIKKTGPRYQKSKSDNSSSKECNSEEDKLQRKVSILKNPATPIHPDASISESEDARKIGEAIMKTVENIKDRQISRDPYLDKVLQELESSREAKASERSYTADVSDRSSIPVHSALKSTAKPWPIPRKDTADDDLPKLTDSLDESKIKAEKPLSESISEPNYLSQLDDLAELKGSPSQVRQINQVISDLEQFRHGKDVKGETEISTTFDKLVETLKEQQLKEEQSQLAAETPSVMDVKPISSRLRTPPICCGLCKKKKAVHVVSFIEFEKNTLSEHEYKLKSEAFETALASLGQETTVEKDIYAPPSNLIVEAEESENQLNHFNQTNKVTAVRIADLKKESNTNTVEISKN